LHQTSFHHWKSRAADYFLRGIIAELTRESILAAMPFAVSDVAANFQAL
jgi:hypothetical protein